MPKYRWKIDIDHLFAAGQASGEGFDDRDEAGIEGPRGCDPSLTTNPGKFEMFDDDGTLYYTGTIWGEYDGLEPLDDFGMPNAGCTTIKLNGEIV